MKFEFVKLDLCLRSTNYAFKFLTFYLEIVPCRLVSRTVRSSLLALRKTDDDTERQLVHTLAHAMVFIVSICCL